MRYWPSVRSKWLDIGQVPWLCIRQIQLRPAPSPGPLRNICLPCQSRHKQILRWWRENNRNVVAVVVVERKTIKIRQPTRMIRQTRQPMSVFLIPVNQSKQLWHHSTPEYIWHHLPKITKTCQTGYTNHDRHKIKIEHDIIDKPVKLDILNEIPAHFIHEIKTIAYDVT